MSNWVLFKLNERVECRDYGKPWYVGRVTSALKVQPDGAEWNAGYSWDEVVRLPDAAGGYQVGGRVYCRDYGKPWYVGRVTSALMVQPDGAEWTAGYSWDEVRLPEALPGGYQVGAVVYSSDDFTFESGNVVEFGERGVVRRRSYDGNGLEVKFDGGVLVDRPLHQVSRTKPARPTKNAIVRINARSERSGSLGVIIQDDHDEKPFKVRFADDVTKWYTESEVQWYGEAEVRARGTNVGDDLQALACLATVVGGVVHFVGVDTTLQVAGFVRDAAGSRGVGGAALRAAGGYFVMSPAADFVAEELAAAGFSLAAAAVLGIETGMILGPAGMVVGAAGAVAVEVVNEVAAAAGLGLLEALGVAESVGVGPVGLAASVVLCTIS